MRQKDADLSTAKESVTQQFQADLAAAEAATVAAQQQLEQVRYHALPCLCCNPNVFSCSTSHYAPCNVRSLYKGSLYLDSSLWVLGCIALPMFPVSVSARCLVLCCYFSAPVRQGLVLHEDSSVFAIVLTACFVQVQAELVSSKDAWEQQQESLRQRHQEGLAALKHRLEQQDGSVRAANLSTEQWKAK